jgi:hypothetical protein
VLRRHINELVGEVGGAVEFLLVGGRGLVGGLNEGRFVGGREKKMGRSRGGRRTSKRSAWRGALKWM